jgi:hypothetical protein
MEAKHTLGPWLVEPPNEESPNRYAIVAATEPHWVVAETVPHILGDPGAANARLISAAPDMLAALEELAGAVGDAETADDGLLAGARIGAAWHAARAAIAKAKGA